MSYSRNTPALIPLLTRVERLTMGPMCQVRREGERKQGTATLCRGSLQREGLGGQFERGKWVAEAPVHLPIPVAR